MADEQRDRRMRIAYRAAAVVFALITVYPLVLFVRGLTEQQVRTGALLYASVTGTITVGLRFYKGWARVLALLFALTNAGLATLALLAVMLDGRGSPVGPAVALMINVGLAWAFTRPVFTLPHER